MQAKKKKIGESKTNLAIEAGVGWLTKRRKLTVSNTSNVFFNVIVIILMRTHHREQCHCTE